MTLLRLLVLCTTAVLVVASRRCCPDGEVMLTKGRQCSNTTDHPLLSDCPRGKYSLDPNKNPDQDNFTVLEDGRLKTAGYFVEEDRYCVTLLVYRNDTVTESDIALICFPDKDPEEDLPSSRRHTTIGVLASISVFFMLLTLLVYALLPEMMDLEGKCLVSYVANLSLAFLILAVLQFAGRDLTDTACTTIAFLEYFWMMSAFFWLSIVSFNMWRTVHYGHTGCPASRMYVRYCICGWGCPLVFLVAALVADKLPDHLDLVRPNFGQSSCWFHGPVETWSYLYGPMAALLCCNVAFFVGTAWKLWRNCCDQSATTLASMRFKCVLNVKLFVVMGITWIFELVSYVFDPKSTSSVWYATDILNALQGVLIFVIAVMCRKRVLRGLTQHRTCGFNWPKAWAAGVDAESHAILPDGDVDMPMGHACDKILA